MGTSGQLAVGAGLSWVLLVLLNHRHVRLTCEAAQPAPDWTDRGVSHRLLFVPMVDCAMDGPVWRVTTPGRAGGTGGSTTSPGSGEAPLLAALAALLVARGRAVGAWLALVLAHGCGFVGGRHRLTSQST